MTDLVLSVPRFESTTVGILVYLVGAMITRRFAPLRDFNIPEPVTGGILAALVTLAIYLASGHEVAFDLAFRDYLLVLFFSAIGLNARLTDLATGGRPFAILLALTVALIVAQNVVGVGVALAFGMHGSAGVLVGSASLIGGHGTTIAWAPQVEALAGNDALMELGIASATLGLILAALLGGPIARFLMARHKIPPQTGDHALTIGIEYADESAAAITPLSFMRTLFVLHVVILIGSALHGLILDLGLNLPLFVPAMLTGIVVGNLLPRLMPTLGAVVRSPSLGLLSDFSLGIFLAMSLMSMQLWTLASMGPMLATALVLQTLLVVLWVVFLVFRLMGAGYTAVVLSSGFAGFALGATPTAIANMTAVTKHYGAAPLAFVILPLVSAFFVDLANAAIIQAFLAF